MDQKEYNRIHEKRLSSTNEDNLFYKRASRLPDSNWKHFAYEANALPLELRRHVVGTVGFEPTLLGLRVPCFSQLSYAPVFAIKHIITLS